MAQWLSYPAFSGPFSGQEQLLAASSTSPGAGMIRIPTGTLASSFLPLLGGPFLPLAGGSLSGPLFLAGAPTQPAGAANKQYVDGQIGASIVTNVMSFGATGNGITDDTAAIQAAIVAAGQGVVWFPIGTYNISSALSILPGQRWVGASKSGAVLRWVGGNSTDMVTNVLGAHLSVIEHLGLNAGTATGMNLLHLQNANECTFISIHLDGMGGAGNTAMFLEGGAQNTAGNTVHCSFYHVVGRNCAVGLVFQGSQTTAPFSAATDNSFFHLDLSSPSGLSGWIGIDFRWWCDTNQFYFTRLTPQGHNCKFVIFNSLDPTGVPSVYDETFSGLILDNIGDTTGWTGLQINASSGIYITGVFISPVTYTGTFIDVTTNPGQARSYYVQTNSQVGLPGGAAVMQVYQKWFGDHPDPALAVPGFARTQGMLGSAQIGSANRIYVTPIFIPNVYTLQTLSIRVALPNGVTNWNVHVGLYADSGFGTPGKLIPDTDTVISVLSGATGNFTTATLNGGAGVPLTRGLYHAAFLCDSASAYVASSGPSGPYDGAISATLLDSARGPLGTGSYSNMTYGALPAIFPLPPTLSYATDVPVTILGF